MEKLPSNRAIRCSLLAFRNIKSKGQWQVANGFTLIELLVVIGIIAVLAAIALPSLRGYARRQTVKNAAVELKSNLRLAQNRSLTGEKTCETNAYLTGWIVSIPENAGSSYTIYGRCSSGTTQNFSSRTFNFPSDVTATISTSSTPTYILFQSNAGGAKFYRDANLTNEIPVTQAVLNLTTASGESYDVSVSTTGNIYETKP